ncbi:regulation of cell growth by extracellular stimulus, partial [Halocaridina rubra]
SEVVSGAVVDVLHAVLAGNDGCVLCFGGAILGKTYTMLGSHTGPGELGVVPSSIAWLYRAIVEQKAKSGARFSVRVSAVAVDAAGAMLTDLLAEYAPEGEASPSALLRDSTGGYLSSVAELRAPSPETAAHYLDVAIAARSAHAYLQTQTPQQTSPSPGSATLLFTLHIYQYAVDKSGKGGG